MKSFLTTDRDNLWQQPVYATFLPEIDPFQSLDSFRALDQAYNGNLTFWQQPSPEPNLPDIFWNQVLDHLVDPSIQIAAARLAGAITAWESDPQRLLFIAILRAGVPIADWLCQLLPGSLAVAVSLFSGLGIDQVAFADIRSRYPDRRIIFVDGWTGRGGVARELARLNQGPLAVLVDPWGVATFAGSYDDLFSPSACFTGLTTLGFSRTFYTNSPQWFSAYLFPKHYQRPQLIKTWQKKCPAEILAPLPPPEPFWKATDLRVHSNEVCRALINAAPECLYFADGASEVQANYPLILKLAELRQVNAVYHCQDLQIYKTRVACTLKSL